jgi:hypothetical protein
MASPSLPGFLSASGKIIQELRPAVNLNLIHPGIAKPSPIREGVSV